MDIKKELGEKIKRIRKLRNLTQEQLAELIDISPRSLSNIEVGSCFVKAETLEKIIDNLNITTEELFANEHIKTKDELIIGIEGLLLKAEKDIKLLEKVYRVLKGLIDEV